MYKPRVSRLEFKFVRQALVNHGFSQFQRNKVEEIFRGDMDETGDLAGIDANELARGIKWMRANKTKHGFSDNQIDLIESELQERL